MGKIKTQDGGRGAGEQGYAQHSTVHIYPGCLVLLELKHSTYPEPARILQLRIEPDVLYST